MAHEQMNMNSRSDAVKVFDRSTSFCGNNCCHRNLDSILFLSLSINYKNRLDLGIAVCFTHIYINGHLSKLQ